MSPSISILASSAMLMSDLNTLEVVREELIAVKNFTWQMYKNEGRADETKKIHDMILTRLSAIEARLAVLRSHLSQLNPPNRVLMDPK